MKGQLRQQAAAFNIISEAGLYKLVMRSDKPEARAFQDWVCGVVLPAIRKDGAYIQGEEKVATGEMSEDEFVVLTAALQATPGPHGHAGAAASRRREAPRGCWGDLWGRPVGAVERGYPVSH